MTRTRLENEIRRVRRCWNWQMMKQPTQTYVEEIDKGKQSTIEMIYWLLP
jgi:hypothetical protein